MPDPFHSCTSYSPPIPTSLPCNIYTSFLARVNLAKSFAAAASWSVPRARGGKRGEEEGRGDGQQVGSWHIAGHRVMDGTGIAARRVAWNFAGHKYFYHFSLACLFVSVCFCFIPVGCDGCGHAGSPGVVATTPPPPRQHTLPGN